eukprot:g4156.t1
MCLSRPEVVAVLLEAGACPNDVDIMGNDAFILACVPGRLDNVKLWLRKFPKWKVNRRNTMFGATALNSAAGQGPCKFELIKFLIEEANASVHCINVASASLLSLAVQNEDADPKVIRYLLRRENMFNINMRRTSQTVKWKLIRGIARIATQTKISRSALLRLVA